MFDPLAKTACGLTEGEVRRIMAERVERWVQQKIAAARPKERVAKPLDHGTLGYWRGCRCDECVAGGRVYRAQRKTG